MDHEKRTASLYTILTGGGKTDGPEVMEISSVFESPEGDVVVVGDLVVFRMSHHDGHLVHPHHGVANLSPTNQISDPRTH